MEPAVLILIFLVAIVASGLAATSAWLHQHQHQHQHQHGQRPARLGGGYQPSHLEPRGYRPAPAGPIDLSKRVDFDLKRLSPEQREHFATTWEAIEQRFVHDPGHSVWEAHALIGEVMRARGYPVGRDFADKSLRDILDANERGQASLEQLRGAMIRYRVLLEQMLGGGRTETQPS
jgi:hypothetical protein